MPSLSDITLKFIFSPCMQLLMYKQFNYVLWVMSLSISNSVCHSWIIYYLLAVKRGAEQNIAQPSSGFVHNSRVFTRKIRFFQSLLPCPVWVLRLIVFV